MPDVETLVGVALCAAFFLFAWLMLSGGTGSVPEWPMVGARVVASVPAEDWLPAPAAGRHEFSFSRPCVSVRDLERRHTSPSKSLRERYWDESPLFVKVADALGYDPVRGFDGLFNTGLVAA